MELKKILIASQHNFQIKGTDKFLHALAHVKVPFKVKTFNGGKDIEKARVLARKIGLEVEFIKTVPHDKMNELFWSADLVLGSFGVGQLDTVAIEAMACGRLVVHHLLQRFYPQCSLQEIDSVEECSSLIEKFLTDEKAVRKQVEAQLSYVRSTHMAPILAERLDKIYTKQLTDG